MLENVLIPTLVASCRDDGDGERARRLIEQVGLGARIDHRPGELSGGERQRVAIARALVRQPRLLLCDEPTGNLDRASAEQVASLLLDLHREQQGILIVVTHSAQLAAQIPDPLRAGGPSTCGELRMRPRRHEDTKRHEEEFLFEENKSFRVLS